MLNSAPFLRIKYFSLFAKPWQAFLAGQRPECSLKGAHDKAASGFWFEPGALGWHDQVGIGHVEELIDGAGVHGDGGHAVSFTSSDQLWMTSDTSDEVHSVVTLDVLDAEDLLEHELVDDLTVELRDGRAEVNFIWLDRHNMPFVVDVEAVGVTRLNLRVFPVSQWADGEVLLECCHEVGRLHVVQRLEDTVVIQDQ